MAPSKLKFTPLIQLLCMLVLAQGTLLVLKIYATSTGQWGSDPLNMISLGLIVFTFVGLLQTQRLTGRRIAVISALADRIIRTGDLSQRIPTESGGEEIHSITGTLNRLLDELEQLMNSTRTASDNLAHDLRHPLTRLRNHLEEFRVSMDAKDCEEEQQKVADLVAECDAVLATFQAILRISNIESSRRHSGFREVSLNAVMNDVTELYEPLAAEKNITLITDTRPASTIGDKDLLFQAFANLVDNAIKYTPDNGAITIGIEPHEKGARITIADNGRGIPDEHKQHVFRRFYRTDSSRSEPGSGLGLSLVSAIVKLHQGSITLSDNQPNGLIVTVTL